MFANFVCKRETKSLFSFEVLVGLSDTRETLLISGLFNLFFYHLVLRFEKEMIFYKFLKFL